MFDHVRAGAGGNEDISARFFEYADRVLHDWTCFRAQTSVEGRLSAAGLVMWEVNAQAEAAENADDGFTSFRVERIDQTGDEELHGRHESIVICFPICNSQISFENLI